MPKKNLFLSLSKYFTRKENKNFVPLLIAVFVLSVFVGIITSILIRQWLIKNMDLLKQIQYQQEVKQIDKLLEKYNY